MLILRLACLMLGSMTPELHRQFELHYPYDNEGKSFADLCPSDERICGATRTSWLYADQSYLSTLILNGLTKDFGGICLPKKAEPPTSKDDENVAKKRKQFASLHSSGFRIERKPETRSSLLGNVGNVCRAQVEAIGSFDLVYLEDIRKGTVLCILLSCRRKGSKLALPVLQGFRIQRKLKQGALYLYVGNGVCAQVEAIGSFNLVLPNGLVICLDNCHYAPTITRGVVSVSRLVDNGFVQCFTDYGISVSKNGVLYFNVVSRNGIYEIDMHDLVPNVNSIYNVSNKRVKHNLDSTYLWHCRLAHINKKRIKQLQQDGLLTESTLPAKPLSFGDKGEGSILTFCKKAGGPPEAASLPSGKGKSVYISPPPYLVKDGIGYG
ncbi:retrotransposon protein, putative, ty1-copia subclass [Tanacetum coccineum]